MYTHVHTSRRMHREALLEVTHVHTYTYIASIASNA